MDINNRINARSHMYGSQIFKCYVHVEFIMRTTRKPLLKLPTVAFMQPLRTNEQILSGRRKHHA